MLQQFSVPYASLQNKTKGSHPKNIGGQKRLSDDFEKQSVSAANTLAYWKVPLDRLDIRHLVKNYLDAGRVKDPVFTENLPGTDWLNRFMKRYQLTQRVSDNIKSS